MRDDREVDTWTGTARSKVLSWTALGVTAVGAAYLVGAVLVGSDGGPALVVGAVVCLLVAGLTALFARVEVTVDGQGLRVASHSLPALRVSFPLEAIEAARVVDHRAFGWGLMSGWGYRGSLRLFRKAAWALRSGPAIELELSGGRRFVVTVDDPEDGVAVLDRLSAGASPRPG